MAYQNVFVVRFEFTALIVTLRGEIFAEDIFARRNFLKAYDSRKFLPQKKIFPEKKSLFLLVHYSLKDSLRSMLQNDLI